MTSTGTRQIPGTIWARQSPDTSFLLSCGPSGAHQHSYVEKADFGRFGFFPPQPVILSFQF